MSREEDFRRTEAGPGNFGECLVGGSPDEQARRRKAKRRALFVSVLLQSLGLAALVISPLLAKPAELVIRNMTPIPEYSSRPAAHPNRDTHLTRPAAPHCSYCFPTRIPLAIVTTDSPLPSEPLGPEVPIGNVGPPSKGLVDALATRVAPARPEPPAEKKRLVVGHIDPALLIHRVEPVFPPLARQIRRSGKVELHAIILTDGTIESLEVVSGDPLFIQSAADAVRQWRYRPTYLNGQPVEIDTFITVVYTLSPP